MSITFKQVIENIENISFDKKALVTHCLIFILEVKHDGGVDQVWEKLV